MRFRTKITIATMLLITVLFGAGFTILITVNYNFVLGKAKEQSDNATELLCSSIYLFFKSDYPDDNSIENVSSSLANHQFDEFFYLRAGLLLYSSNPDLTNEISLPSDINSALLIKAGEKNFLLNGDNILIAGQSYTYFTLIDVTYIVENRNQMIRTFLWVYAVVIAIGSVVSWILSTQLLKPLTRLVRATKELANGNIKYRAKVKTKDELGLLTARFNSMADQIEDNIRSLEEASEQKDRFMGAFTHELKTPMTSIIGYSELLLTQQLSETDANDALNYIHSESKRLESMSMKLLDLFVAGNTSIELKSVNAADLVRGTVDELSSIYEYSGIKLNCQTQTGICRLDPDYFKTVLTNVIDNARKAVMDNPKDRPPYITVIQRLSDSKTIIEVTDNGKGIPADTLNHLTEAFYRVDKSRSRAQGGSGLGLALTAKIIELHNGTINFYSKENCGTKVVITI